ncbi:hypothetical protein ANN_03136 [Periplaneta americana]|uniref:Death domain-containing protein n=1 Tax=Periplaneta americana TaxID=6978 RepID=A0ABQ8U0U9_PERAM|nr:hypothetical protein ANN_03136 [Periplaneta americana]
MLFCGLQRQDQIFKCKETSVLSIVRTRRHLRLSRSGIVIFGQRYCVERTRSGNSGSQEETIENVRRSFERSPKKSIKQAARELGMKRSMEEEDGTENNLNVLNTARRKWRLSESRGSTAGTMQHDGNERLRELLFRVAYKQLAQGEWKRLAHHWAFTEEQIKAIEHQYTAGIQNAHPGLECMSSILRKDPRMRSSNPGSFFICRKTSTIRCCNSLGPSSYKEHGFRMLLIWAHGLGPEVNPVKELYESLTAIGKKGVADALRKKLDEENEGKFKKGKRRCNACSIT